MDAAAELVAERGWSAVTTRAVAERAGVNQALVHYHFGNMDALRRESVVARLGPIIEAVAEELISERPFPEGVSRTMALLDRILLEPEPTVLMAEALLQATRDPAMTEALGQVLGSWAALLEPRIVIAQQRGTVRDDLAPSVLARLLAAIFDGLLLQRLADPGTDLTAAGQAINLLLTPPSEAAP
jgi:AcrR family transcriptional regulator